MKSMEWIRTNIKKIKKKRIKQNVRVYHAKSKFCFINFHVHVCVCVCMLVLGLTIQFISYCGLRVEIEKHSSILNEPLHFVAEKTEALKI